MGLDMYKINLPVLPLILYMGNFTSLFILRYIQIPLRKKGQSGQCEAGNCCFKKVDLIKSLTISLT